MFPTRGRDGAATGRIVGDFRIGAQLGAGGYGIVYHAEQMSLGRRVVVKVLRGQDAADEAGTQSFLREARLASLLDHPYAAHTYAFGAEPDGLRWLAMEWVRGTPLDVLLTSQARISLPRWIPLLEKICEVVYSAHQQGIIHRDIKPANIMVLSRAGTLLPKLLDFGIAKITSDEIPQRLGHLTTAGRAAVFDSSPDGPFVGSPAYMAPERWSEDASSDARSDQYALAILAYEAITGVRPFRHGNMTDLARAHLRDPIPPLGDGFASQLDLVLARAMAKKPDERYDDVLQFARAFRDASECLVVPDFRPSLDASLRDQLIARAPRPVADSVAQLAAADDSLSAIEAGFQVARVAIRFVGLIAIAARTRYGTAFDDDSDAVNDALSRLRRRLLTTEDWLDIARALVHGFIDKPDVHPVPELVLLFSEPTTRGAAADGRPLVEVLREVEQYAQAEDPDQVSIGLLRALASLLTRLSFLCDYRLVVHREHRNELWMGERRAANTVISVAAAEGELTEGDVVLVGADGELLLALHPLCQLHAPSPGAPKELFLFEGNSRLGARMVAFPIGFEWHDDAFWAWYEQHLGAFVRVHDGTRERAVDYGNAPYKGLSAFSPADANNYFGREREVAACVNRLRVEPLLVVVGPSGAGKSSFVQAGIIPALPAHWRALTVRPGPKPVSVLAAALHREGIGETADALATRIERDADALGRLLRKHAVTSRETVVLVIDQFEELLTLGSDEHERNTYTKALIGAVRTREEPVRLIITLRDDFLLRTQTIPAFRERLTPSLQLLATPPPDELVRILIEPARRAGYDFEDAALPAEMVQAIADEPSALALLSFTASKLWELRDRHFCRLRRHAYETLGGVGGALAQHAEASLASMPAERLPFVREVFRQLVTADGTRAILTRRELHQVLGNPDAADAVLEELIVARLLVASEGDSGEDRVEVVHEALLSSWPRLVAWQRKDAENVRLRDQLRAAARQWVARDRSKGLLWRGDALLEYRLWRARYPGSLTDDENQFANASLRAQARSRRLRSALSITAITVLAVVVVVVLQLNQRANREREQSQVHAADAQRHLLELFTEQGRLALLDGKVPQAFAYLREARLRGADGPGVRFLLARATDALNDEKLVIPAHDGPVYTARFSPDGTYIATAGTDKTVKIWNAADGTLHHVLEGHEQAIWTVGFSSDSEHMISGSWDGTARVWSVATGRMQWLAKHKGRLYWAAFSSDGRQVGTAGMDNKARIWDAKNGRLLRTLDHTAGILSAAYSPDGKYIATGSLRGRARVFDTQTGALITTSEPDGGFIYEVEIDPTGTRVGIASRDNLARILAFGEQATGEALALVNHDAVVSRVAFSADGTRMVTVSDDQTAKVWDSRTGALQLSLDAHTGGIADVLCSPDGKRIVTLSRDGTARGWNAATGDMLWTFFGHTDAIWTGDIDSAGDSLLTADFDGMVRVWDVRKTMYERLLSMQGTDVHDAEFSPDGGLIATVSLDKAHDRVVVGLWQTNGEQLARFESEQVNVGQGRLQLRWRPDGRGLIVSGGAQAVVWNIRVDADPVAREHARIDNHGERVWDATYSADGSDLVTVGEDGTVKIWRADTGALRRTLEGHDKAIVSVDIDRRGRYLATASRDKTARIWDWSSGALLRTLEHVPPQEMHEVRFSPDGQFVITAGVDTTAVIWAIAGQRVATLEGHSGSISSVAFSPDGHLAATGGDDSTIKVWATATGALLWSSGPQENNVRSVVFSTDGKRLAATHGQTAKLWPVHYDEHTSRQLDALAACRVGYVVSSGRIQRVVRDHSRCRRQRQATDENHR